MRKCLWVIAAAALLLACKRVPPDRQIIDDAINAMGGNARVQGVGTLLIEGEGISPNLGQNITPEAELPVWKVTDFKRSIDVPNGRMRVQQTRTANFLFAGSTVQRQDYGVDGTIAWVTGEDGLPRRSSTAVFLDRGNELVQHPLVLVRYAAQLSNPRDEGGRQLVDITLNGYPITLAIDGRTKLPVYSRSALSNPNLGDVTLQTEFLEYQDVNGLKLPMHLVTKVDKYTQFDLRVSKYTVNADVGNLEAPLVVKSAELPPDVVPATVTAEPVARGIWWLAGSGNHRSVVFEFDDHLVLFEVPLNETRTKAVIARARSLVKGKPLTHAVVSHHHFDHSGGLRTAVAAGLTIITYKGNVEFFKDLVARKHTIERDELEKHPQPLKIEPVDDELILKDKSMEVRLYHVKDNPREGTNLFAYVPRDKLLVQADLYDSTWLQYPWADNFMWNIKQRGLQVDKDVPVHGAIQSYADVLKTMESKRKQQGK